MYTRIRISRGLISACCALGTGAFAPVAPAAPRAQTPSVEVPTIEWESCGEGFDESAQCARVPVPLDYDRPLGEKTWIALARIPATNSEERIGTLFINPGGPGGSGVATALGSFGPSLVAELQGRFDVIGFDPRGVGASEPLRCFDSEDARNAFFGDTPLFPYERGQELPFYRWSLDLAAQCLSRGQRITGHMSTADVARDLDLLRRAVGDEGLYYLGFSYGSFIGNTYAKLFPKKVRRLVIDGVLNAQLWASGWQVRSDRVATEEVWGEFLRLCDEAAEACAFHAPGGSKARYQALLESVRESPIDFGGGFFYTYDFLIADTISSTYSPEFWSEDAAYFAELAAAALGDDAAAATRAAALREAREARLAQGRATPRADDYDNSFEAFYGNHCADAQYPSRFAHHRAVGTYAERGSPFGPYWWWFNAPCAIWPVSKDRHAGPWGTRTARPALVVGNFFDPATAYSGAKVSARRLRGSRLLSYAGWGHTAFGRSDCVTDHVLGYLLDGTLPRRGTVCPANSNPFRAVRSARRRLPPIGLPPMPFPGR